MLSKRWQIGLLLFSTILALSSIACFGVNQIPLSTTLPPSTYEITPSQEGQILPTPQPPPIVPPSPTLQNSPTAPSSPTEQPLPTDTPAVVLITPTKTGIPPLIGQVNLLEINGFMDESKFWYFYGLVRNDTNRTIFDIQIEIRLMDSSGAKIYTYTTYTNLGHLNPGEITPFSDFTTEAFPNGKTMQATVVGFNSTLDYDKAPLDFRGITSWIDDKNNIYLAGEVFNGNETPVEINSIAGSLMDDSGKLVTASYAYPFLGYLGVDESSPFVMIFNAPFGQTTPLTNYTLFSDSETINPISSQAISFTSNNHKYQDSNGDTHLVGFVTNNSSQPMSLYLLAGAYDGDANCIDANSIFLPVPINPGQSIPYDFTMWSVIDAVPSAFDNSAQFKVNIDWLSSNQAPTQSSLLVTKEDTHIFSGSVGTFNGTVINNTGKDLSTVIVIVALYDKSTGDLIATNYSYVTEAMTKNSSGNYQVYLYPPANVDPENFKIEITAFGQ